METLGSILPYIQIVLAVILVGLVLIQQSEGSLGSAFGGGDGFGAQYRTRRGAELYIFRATITVSVLFVLAAIAHLFI